MARTPLPPSNTALIMQNLSPCFCFQIADDYFLAPGREKKGTGPLLRPSLPQDGSCSNPKERAEVSGSPFAGLLGEMESVTYIPSTSSGTKILHKHGPRIVFQDTQGYCAAYEI